MKNSKYQSIIDFITFDLENLDWKKKPFNSNNRTFVTNGYLLLSMPYQKGYVDRSEKLKEIFPFNYNKNVKISLLELKEKFSKFPKLDCYDDIEKICDSCNGDGTIEIEYEHNCSYYEIEAECPVCEGYGKIISKSKIPNGKKEIDESKYFKIGNLIFNIKRIEELIFIAESLKSNFITVVSQNNEKKFLVFKIKDVELVIMSSDNVFLENIIENIEI